METIGHICKDEVANALDIASRRPPGGQVWLHGKPAQTGRRRLTALIGRAVQALFATMGSTQRWWPSLHCQPRPFFGPRPAEVSAIYSHQKGGPFNRASSRLQGRVPQCIQDACRHVANGSRPLANAKNASLFCRRALFDRASTVRAKSDFRARSIASVVESSVIRFFAISHPNTAPATAISRSQNILICISLSNV